MISWNGNISSNIIFFLEFLPTCSANTIALKTSYGYVSVNKSNPSVIEAGKEKVGEGATFYVEAIGMYKIRLKSFYGKYLSAREEGFVVASSENTGIQEIFRIYQTINGMVKIKAYNDKFIVLQEIEVGGSMVQVITLENSKSANVADFTVECKGIDDRNNLYHVTKHK